MPRRSGSRANATEWVTLIDDSTWSGQLLLAPTDEHIRPYAEEARYFSAIASGFEYRPDDPLTSVEIEIEIGQPADVAPIDLVWVAKTIVDACGRDHARMVRDDRQQVKRVRARRVSDDRWSTNVMIVDLDTGCLYESEALVRPTPYRSRTFFADADVGLTKQWIDRQDHMLTDLAELGGGRLHSSVRGESFQDLHGIRASVGELNADGDNVVLYALELIELARLLDSRGLKPVTRLGRTIDYFEITRTPDQQGLYIDCSRSSDR